MGEEGLDLRDTHLSRVSFVVEQDVTLDPGDVGLFGANGIVLETYGLANLVQ